MLYESLGGHHWQVRHVYYNMFNGRTYNLLFSSYWKLELAVQLDENIDIIISDKFKCDQDLLSMTSL